MRTLGEVIEQHKRDAKDLMHEAWKCEQTYDSLPASMGAKRDQYLARASICKVSSQEHKQLVEWLEELETRRQVQYFKCEAENCKYNKNESCGRLDLTIASQIVGCPPVCCDFEDATWEEEE